MGFVGVEGFQEGAHRGGFQLASHMGQGKDLVTGVFHGTGLVGMDVTGGGGDHALVIVKHGGDDRGVGLGAAYKKMHICFRTVTCGPDLFCGGGTVDIVAVAGLGFQIGLQQPLQHLGVSAGDVIIFKGNHVFSLPFLVLTISIYSGGRFFKKNAKFLYKNTAECDIVIPSNLNFVGGHYEYRVLCK